MVIPTPIAFRDSNPCLAGGHISVGVEVDRTLTGLNRVGLYLASHLVTLGLCLRCVDQRNPQQQPGLRILGIEYRSLLQGLARFFHAVGLMQHGFEIALGQRRIGGIRVDILLVRPSGIIEISSLTRSFPKESYLAATSGFKFIDLSKYPLAKCPCSPTLHPTGTTQWAGSNLRASLNPAPR